MKTNYILISALLVGVGFLTFLSFPKSSPETSAPTANNVRQENGQQTIEITAKGGYSPRVTIAKANLPTTLKVKTQGTFDCSSSLTIPQLNFNQILSNSEEVEIPIPSQKSGSIIRGLCSMGMYNFEIQFS